MQKVKLKDQLGRVIRLPTETKPSTPVAPSPGATPPSNNVVSPLWLKIREIPGAILTLAKTVIDDFADGQFLRWDAASGRFVAGDADGLPYPILTDQVGNVLTDQAGNTLIGSLPAIPFAWLVERPTTLAGYGITDAAKQRQAYTLTTLPVASSGAPDIMVTNLTGGMEPCWSDGTNWRRYSDRSIAN
jgi:hypothetical protein